MNKEAEILRKCVSCHDEHMCQKSRKSRGSCISGVSVLQKVTLKCLKPLYTRRSFSFVKGKFTKKASWFERRELTKRR